LLKAQQGVAAAASVADFLDKIYNKSGRPEDLASLTDEEIIELGEHLTWRAFRDARVRRRDRDRNQAHAGSRLSRR